MKPLISVVIPVYNVEKYLRQCLDSLLVQTFPDFEAICVDDGSTDGSLTILEEYQEKDKRIHVYTQKNQYAGVARNNGLKYAKGEYTLFFDADDFLGENSLLELFHVAEENKADIVVFGHYKYNTKNESVEASDYVLKKLEWFGDGVKSAEQIAPYIFNFSEPSPWNKLYRTEFIKKSNILFMPLRSANDLFFSYMTLAVSKRTCVYKKQLLYYRVNNGESLQGNTNEVSMDFIRAIEELKNKLSDLFIFEYFETSFYNLLISTFAYQSRRYKGKPVFKEFYEIVKKYMTQEFRIEGYVPNEYINRYDYYQVYKIINFSYEDYVEFETGEKKISHPYHYFPYWLLPKNKNVVIYGAGNVGKFYYFQLSRMNYCQSLKMTDSAYETIDHKDVCSVEAAITDKTDYVVIAVADVKVKEEIEEQLKKMEYKFKIVWQ